MRYFSLQLLISLIILSSCNPEKKGQFVSTGDILEITPVSATVEGSVNDLPGNVVQHGHCYSTASNPTVGGNCTRLGKKDKTGSFQSEITGLDDQTNYYVRAYASFSTDTVCYGEEVTFLTEGKTLPVVKTGTVDADDISRVSMVGVLEEMGRGVSRVSAHGHVWSESPGPVLDAGDSHSDNGASMATGEFYTVTGDLEAASTYYIKAYATNEVGTAYGEESSFNTAGVPAVKTGDLELAGINAAHVSGEVMDDGGVAITSMGFCASSRPEPTINDIVAYSDENETGAYSATIRGLDETTSYSVRAFVSNEYTTVYGEEIVVETAARPVMIDISGGSFTMGKDEADKDYSPAHRVTLSSFQLSKYEITNLDYAIFMMEDEIDPDGGSMIYPDEDPRVWESNGKILIPVSGAENLPVVNVTWQGAWEYCDWAKGQLPTEAQWEYAARGGSDSDLEYSGGNSPGEVGYFWDNSSGSNFPVFQGRGPMEVGLKKANSLGIYDMSGNVWEWCADWYDEYSSDSENDPSGPETSTEERVGRGGSWRTEAESMSVYFRGRNRDKEYPDWHSPSLGFRMAK